MPGTCHRAATIQSVLGARTSSRAARSSVSLIAIELRAALRAKVEMQVRRQKSKSRGMAGAQGPGGEGGAEDGTLRRINARIIVPG